MLELELKRVKLAKRFTRGMMYARGFFVCHMLEDTYRPPPEKKIPRETCIPVGVYNVEITHSPKFGRDMPLVWNHLTPDGRKLVMSADGTQVFEGIRLHAGNTIDHTEGCPLTGSSFVESADGETCKVLDSLTAFGKLERMIAAELAKPGGRVQLTVSV